MMIFMPGCLERRPGRQEGRWCDVRRARVLAGKATTTLKLPVSLQIVLRAFIEEGLKRGRRPEPPRKHCGPSPGGPPHPEPGAWRWGCLGGTQESPVGNPAEASREPVTGAREVTRRSSWV